MSEKIFDNLSDLCDESEDRITCIESLCMSCGQNGMTRMLMTEIPFFRQVVVVSFQCDHCGHTNNELQPVQQIGERGIRFAVQCKTAQDLSRRVVKTEWAEISVPEVEFEVKKQTGLITTIEGILDRAVEGLQQTIKLSPDLEPESRQKLIDFVLKISELKDGKQCFTFILNDISGNSFVESLCAPEKDPQVECDYFIRSIDEDRILGIYEADGGLNNEDKKDNLKEEVLQFATNCSNCSAPAFTNMKVTRMSSNDLILRPEKVIPHFKEVIIMATNCDTCGHKTNEVKAGSGVEPNGVKITFKVNDENDLNKDVVISNTCSIAIPELDIHLTSTGSGRYTTLEGIAHLIKEDLKTSNPFLYGDSGKEEIKEKLNTLLDKLSNLIGYTIILDDPCGNSYVEDAIDVQTYERSFEQNEELGLNDIKTENYS